MNRAIVRGIVEKSIGDIKENPQKAINRLVGTTELFSNEEKQSEFTRMLLADLEKEDSMYSRMIEQLVYRTDPLLLTALGMSLGYESIGHGGKTIRKLEKKMGHSLPWAILFDLRDGVLNAPVIEAVIGQGKALGIHTYMFFGGELPGPHELLNVMAEERECAFILFVPPVFMTDSRIRLLKTAGHIVVVLDMDAGADAGVAGRLSKARCFFGGFTRYRSLNEKMASHSLSRAAGWGYACLVLLNEKRYFPQIVEGRQGAVDRWRYQPAEPVFLVDLYEDIARVGHNISENPCVVTVCRDRFLAADFAGGKTVQPAGRLGEISLAEALRQIMHKR